MLFVPGSFRTDSFIFLPVCYFTDPAYFTKKACMYANYTVKARGSEDEIVTLLALMLYAYLK